MLTREELLKLLKDYTQEEITQIEKDLKDIISLSFDSARPATTPAYLPGNSRSPRRREIHYAGKFYSHQQSRSLCLYRPRPGCVKSDEIYLR